MFNVNKVVEYGDNEKREMQLVEKTDSVKGNDAPATTINEAALNTTNSFIFSIVANLAFIMEFFRYGTTTIAAHSYSEAQEFLDSLIGIQYELEFDKELTKKILTIYGDMSFYKK